MSDIFLSYSEKDREQARRVAATLESVGWTVWWDRRIPAGETWRNVLEKALTEMRCMVVLWSAHSIVSEWVYEEASEGRRQRKLFPVLIEAVRPPTGFREIQAADLSDWDGSRDFEAMRLLIADLAQVLGHAEPREAASRKATAETPGPAGDLVVNDHPAVPDSGADASPRWPLSRAQTWTAAGALLGSAAIAYFSLSADAPGVASRQVPEPATSALPAAPPEQSTAAPQAPAAVPALPPAAAPQPAAAPTRLPLASSTAPARTTSGKRAATAASSRCADLLARVQLGEPLADAEQSALREECRQ